MRKITNAIISFLEEYLPCLMQFVYRVYLYFFFKSCGWIVSKDEASAKEALLKEASKHDTL